MDFILIYGPPASGKFTVAKELAKRTGYTLFHNHSVLDLVGSIFEWGSKPFCLLRDKFRKEIISTAAKYKLKGLIFTFCYAKHVDDDFVRELLDSVKKYKGNTHCVLLTCDEKELFKRVKLPSRKKFEKISSVESLKKVLSSYELSSPMEFVPSLIIDTTDISPKQAVDKIIINLNIP